MCLLAFSPNIKLTVKKKTIHVVSCTPTLAAPKTRPEFTRKATLLNLLLVLISGWGGGEVGGVWEIMATVPLFFSTVPSRGRSKPGQERVAGSNQPQSKLVGLN